MTTTARRTMTVEEFCAYEGEGHADLIDGELIEMAAGSLHGFIASEIGAEVRNFVRAKGLGRVYSSDTTYILSLSRRTAVRPDVSFLTQAHVQALPDPEREPQIPPDLAVEVVSPTDRATDVNAKVRAYLEAGTQLVWVVDPLKRTAVVYKSGGEARFLSESDALDGGDLLPGFSLPLAQLFEI